MRVLVISDSHGKNDDVKNVIKQVGHIDMLIHLGDIERGPEYIASLVDCPVHMVSGNNDYNIHVPYEDTFMIDDFKVFITHGHRFYVNAGLTRLEEYAKENGIDVVMYGHTHVPYISIGDEYTILNPGSISYPRQEGRKKTFLIMEIDKQGNAHYAHGELRSSLQDVYRGFY